MNHVRQLLDHVHAQTVSLQRARELYQDRLAPDFNMFAFIDTGEVNLSRVIAWLLDTSATHGQGHKFLADFLTTIELDWDAGAVGKGGVRCEESTALRRRIDIIVKSGGWTLGIENKLRGAGDSQDQVSDYLAHLDSLSAQGPRCLVYLTVNGTLPAEHSIPSHEIPSRVAAQQLKPVGVDGLIGWLQRCRISCRASRVAGFIEDFETFLARDIKGIRDMTERDQLIELITQSKINVDAAMKIIFSDVRKCLFDNLCGQIREDLSGEKDIFTDISGYATDGKYANISILFDTRYRFLLEFQQRDYNDLIYGVHLKKDLNGAHNIDDIADDLNRRLGGGARSSAWPWYRVVSLNDQYLGVSRDWGVFEQSETPWGQIVDGTMAKKIAGAVRLVYSALSSKEFIPSQVDKNHNT